MQRHSIYMNLMHQQLAKHVVRISFVRISIVNRCIKKLPGGISDETKKLDFKSKYQMVCKH